MTTIGTKKNTHSIKKIEIERLIKKGAIERLIEKSNFALFPIIVFLESQFLRRTQKESY
jgi:hypothetical protein